MTELDANLPVVADYEQWLSQVKSRIQTAQQYAAVTVNQQLLQLYWQLGTSILQQQAEQGWGTKVVDQLAQDLRRAFPTMKGFSARNLKYMRRFADVWRNPQFVQQPAAQLPWFHHCTLLDKLGTEEERLFYMQKAQQYGWSRNVLVHHIESNLIGREGKALTNFTSTLPNPLSDLAHETFKDPYKFDFLNLGQEHSERELETALTQHISQFLLELGAGFAYVGRQVHLEVGDQDFYLDLLFYHLKLRAYIVVELKAGEFKPEYAGKLSFYLSAVDSQVKNEQDNPTIGLLLCKTQNKIIAEYALRDNSKPIGVAEYQLAQALPADLEDKLPSIERIERELASELGDGVKV